MSGVQGCDIVRGAVTVAVSLRQGEEIPRGGDPGGFLLRALSCG